MHNMEALAQSSKEMAGERDYVRRVIQPADQGF
jgi:hypothetical protein